MTSYGEKTTGLEVAKDLHKYIEGKTILVTGVAEGGLGGEFAETVATANPGLIICTARSASKAQVIVDRIAKEHPSLRTRILLMDLASLKSVRKAASEVDTNIDVLVNNAAVMASPYMTTEDGFEMQFGVGHLGHFLFTNLLLKAGKINDEGRIVNVSSLGHRRAGVQFDDPGFSGGKTYEQWTAYGQAKTANILYSVDLATRLKDKNILAYSLHPGGIKTNLGRHMDKATLDALIERVEKSDDMQGWKTLNQGISTHMVAAFDPSIISHNGCYLVDCQPSTAEQREAYATDPENARRLWTLSEELVGEKFDIGNHHGSSL